jgi:glyoxylase-like metal-dependent hydrolase (beta-lactamase superfamily II)
MWNAKMPEEMAPGVYRVDAARIPYFVSVLLIRCDDGWALVDTGSSIVRILQALAALGARPEELRRIFLTHHHAEHVRGLPDIRRLAPSAKVVTSKHEAEILADIRNPDPLLDPLSSLIAVRGLPTVPMSSMHVVDEGSMFADFRVIATPGHTRGHTSLLSEQHGLLFAGDAFGRLPELRVGANNAICTDPIEAKQSARKLLKEEFTTVVFSHGKPLRGGDAKQRLRGVVDRYRHV